jgi:nicotinate-nucleotide pyrophosphorylase (carboxylating)
MYHDLSAQWKELLRQGLRDDGYPWDWTTLGTLQPGGSRAEKRVRARIVAKAEGVFAGAGLARAAERISEEMDLPLKIRLRKRDGDRVRPRDVVYEWSGPARSLLALERPFLNLASFVSGTATATRRLVDEVDRAWKRLPTATTRGFARPRVIPTRKMLPGYRDAGVHGVICGGGAPHRVNLAGGVLIKENHIAAAGSIRAAIAGARAVAPHGLKIEIEVRDRRELREAVRAGAEVVMLDNFTPAQVADALAGLPGTKPLIEVSGNVSPETIGAYAQPGVDLISSGSLTHSVKALDLSLLVEGL